MSKKVLTAALALSLFLLIVGAKWASFDRFGSPMPDWDQWDAEAVELFIPWFEHDHFIAHLFHPHNEHRVVLTKLQNLALGLVNGQWDSRLEAATNALLHAALAVGFWLFGRRGFAAGSSLAPASGPAPLPGTARMPAVLSAACFLLAFVLFGLPIAWQNVLGGFHSQQYWLLGLSFAAIITLPFERTWTVQWWLGATAALLALGSMGSGFLAAAIVLVVLAWRLARRETTLREAWPTLALMGVLVAIGLLTRVEVEWHQKLKATTAHDFFFSIVHSLQWPMRDHHWAAAVMWLPWLIAAWQVVRRRGGLRPALGGSETRPTGNDRAGQATVALGGWVLVQIVATAYARGAGADYPASRYMDTLTFGAMVNAVALGWLLSVVAPKVEPDLRARSGKVRAEMAPGGRRPPFLLILITLAWLITLGFGLHRLMNDVLRYELPDARKYYGKAEGHMRRYLASNDPQQLAHPDIPFPSAEGLIERLARPSLRALMPLPIRAPLDLVEASAQAASVFLENDARGSDVEHPPRTGLSPNIPPLDAAKTWGSFGGEHGIAATGEWKSAPLVSTRGGWLKFETAGQLGEPGVALELHAAHGGDFLAAVKPDKVPRDSWRAAYVRAPREPFIVVARDADPARWLAFSGPVEMGTFSYWAWRVTKHGLLIMYLGATAGILLGAATLGVRRHQ